MGLDVYLVKGRPRSILEWWDSILHCWDQHIEIPSTKYPEHLWKIGYFRSSYNGLGFNSMMLDHGLPTLYDIFEGANSGCVHVDWTDALERVKDALRRFDETADQLRYRAMNASALPHRAAVSNEQEALRRWEEERRRWEEERTSKSALAEHGGAYGYWCADGFIHPAGLRVYAIFPNNNHAYVVVDNEHTEWYRRCYEIVQETIEWVLDRPDETYHLDWSA